MYNSQTDLVRSSDPADRLYRKMDMLSADLHLKNEVTAKKQSKKSKSSNSDDDAGFHFIAYVPIDDNVWKLDGLERQPQKLGDLEFALNSQLRLGLKIGSERLSQTLKHVCPSTKRVKLNSLS